MRTARSSSRHGGGRGLGLIPLNSPLGCGPGSDPPQFPPWCGTGPDPPQFPPLVWAWIWSPSISPLGVGLEGGGLLGKGVSLEGGLPGGGSPWRGVSLEGVSLERGSPWRGFSLEGVSLEGVSLEGGYPSMHWGRPPVNRMTDACENITLPQTSFAGGNNVTLEFFWY